MKDRYLFRGKAIDENEWVIGFLSDKNIIKWKNTWYEPQAGCCDVLYHVNPKTIGQSTGLKDKHGKLIFEGDKVKLSGLIAYDTRVVYKDGGFCMEYNIDDDWVDTLPFNGHNNFATVMKGIEVIGNIHEFN